MEDWLLVCRYRTDGLTDCLSRFVCPFVCVCQWVCTSMLNDCIRMTDVPSVCLSVCLSDVRTYLRTDWLTNWLPADSLTNWPIEWLQHTFDQQIFQLSSPFWAQQEWSAAEPCGDCRCTDQMTWLPASRLCEWIFCSSDFSCKPNKGTILTSV